MRSKPSATLAKAGDPEKLRATEILEAASALLAESGSDGFTAAAVARRAGVNKALIFYYWGSVPDLFERVLAGYYAAHRQAIEAALQSSQQPNDRVHRVVDAYLDFMRDNQAYARIVVHQVAGEGPYAAVVRAHYGEITRWAVELLASLVPGLAEATARQLHLSISAVVVNTFTYAPGLAEAWPERDPLGKAAVAERRAHVHWLVDACLAAL